MKKQITINQHYVPRFYMKPFAEVIRKNCEPFRSYRGRLRTYR